MTVTINGSSGITAPEVILDNTTADGGQVVLKSSGYSDWNLDNYSGRFRAYYGSTEYFTVTNSGNVGIGTSSPASQLDVSKTGDAVVSLTSAGVQRYQLITRSGGRFDFQDQSAGATRWSVDQSGNLLVSKTADTDSVAGTVITLVDAGGAGKHGKIKVTNTVGTGQYILQGLNASGSTVGGVTTTSTATAYNTSSDYRLKENIAPMTGALAVVQELNPVTYTWKSTGEATQGFIAHELAEVVPECVTGEKDAVDADGNPVYQGIDTSFLVATLTAAIQEQQAIIESLRTRIETLENK